jgi:DNA polymerase III subunit delta'
MKVIGHQKTISHIFDLIRNERLPHALLFTGPEGIGKKRVALHLVQRLFCKNPEGPCEICSDCRRVAALQHPDLFWVEPEKDLIKIETVRVLKNALALKPFEAPVKAAVLVDAHSLNPAASNALLKTLEEPPPGTLLILTTFAPHRFLKTILSRCQKVYFSPLSTEETRAVLELTEEGKDLSPELILQSEGSPGRALNLSPEAWEKVRKTILPALQTQPKDLLQLFSAAEEIAQDESLHKPVLQLLMKEWREKLVKKPSSSDLKKFDAIGQALRALDHYANPLLTFETLFLNLCL